MLGGGIMVAFSFLLSSFIIILLTYLALKKMKLLSRNTKIVSLAILIFILFLFLSQILDTNSKDLGSGFVYNSEHRHITGRIDIPPNVISCEYNDDFIIAKQLPTEIHNAIYDKMNYVYKYGKDNIYYWIIIHKDSIVLGPMDSLEYTKAREKYHIPEKLNLQ